jgi:hypothetical protein
MSSCTRRQRTTSKGWWMARLAACLGGRAGRGPDRRALRDMIPEAADAELYSSDLQRARQTAIVVGDRLRVRPVLDRRLREKSCGEAGGRPQAWLDQRFVPPPATGDRMQHDEGIPGAETKAAFAQRVYAAATARSSASAIPVIWAHDSLLGARRRPAERPGRASPVRARRVAGIYCSPPRWNWRRAGAGALIAGPEPGPPAPAVRAGPAASCPPAMSGARARG